MLKSAAPLKLDRHLLMRSPAASGGRHVEVAERVGGHSQGAILEAYSRKLLVVHRLDDHPCGNAETTSGFGRQQDLVLGHRAPPSSSPNLPWSMRMTVASSSCRPSAA